MFGQWTKLLNWKLFEISKDSSAELDATCKDNFELAQLFYCNEIPPMLSRLTTNPQFVVSQSFRVDFVEFNLLRQK